MKYQRAADRLTAEIRQLLKELETHKNMMNDLQKYKNRKNAIGTRYNSTVSSFKKEYTKLFTDRKKPVVELNSVPSVGQMNTYLTTARRKLYTRSSESPTTFEDRLRKALRSVEDSVKTKPSSRSDILAKGVFSIQEIGQIKQLLQPEVVRSRRLDLISKLTRKQKVSAILTQEAAAARKTTQTRQPSRASVLTNQRGADNQQQRIQSLIANSGIRVTRANTKEKKKVAVF